MILNIGGILTAVDFSLTWFDLDLTWLVLLLLVAFVAGIIDAIAGGGGMLTVPALLLTGMNPVVVLATNKLQSSFGSVSASITFFRKGYLTDRRIWVICGVMFVASVLGAMSVNVLPRAFLEVLVPIMLIFIAVFFLCSPKLVEQSRPAKVSWLFFFAFIAPVIGFYDGVFGPGTGSFLTIAFFYLLGKGLIESVAMTRAGNAASNLGALAFFLYQGHINIPLGLAMGLFQFFGAQVGVHLAVKKGTGLIKPMLVTVCSIMALKLLWPKMITLF